jgi:hypothetical protein
MRHLSLRHRLVLTNLMRLIKVPARMEFPDYRRAILRNRKSLYLRQRHSRTL